MAIHLFLQKSKYNSIQKHSNNYFYLSITESICEIWNLKRPAKAERLHSFHIISPGTFSVKLSLLRLSFPFPSWRSPVLPPTLTHPRHPPGPDGYKCSALLQYRYAPSNTGASLDSYLTSPYCCSKCDGRHAG